MKTETYIKIIQKGAISDELELEKAFIIERKLRLLSATNPDFKEVRSQLRQIIKNYEKKNWSSESEISDEKIKESFGKTFSGLVDFCKFAPSSTIDQCR